MKQPSRRVGKPASQPARRNKTKTMQAGAVPNLTRANEMRKEQTAFWPLERDPMPATWSAGCQPAEGDHAQPAGLYNNLRRDYHCCTRAAIIQAGRQPASAAAAFVSNLRAASSRQLG